MDGKTVEDKEQLLTYNFQEVVNIKEIQQGDIFRNIPYYSPDYLIKSTIKEINVKTKNEAEIIFDDIIQNKKIINAKSIIFPTWAILASQECDIRRGFDLIFFPLVKYKGITKQDNLVKFIEEDIQKWTRYMYIPKSDLESKKFGPFRVLLQNPFYISYEIIEKNLNYCWVTHIVEKVKKVFVGKITNLFTRTPVDELVFIEFNQIENYFQKKWLEAWVNKATTPYEKSASEIIDKIIEFYFLLKHENKHSQFQKFKIIDFNLLKEIKDLADKSWIFKKENPFLAFYRELIEAKTDNWFLIFYNFIDKVIYIENSIFKTFEEQFKLIDKFKDEEEKEFFDYTKNNINKNFQNLTLDILRARIQSPIIQREKYFSYCKPFEKLRSFLIEIRIL